MENAHLIVGLGNPGSEYAKTRHNAGFLVTDRLAERWRAAWSLEKKFQARVARAERAGQRALLCQPQTFMNSSGEAVGEVMRFFGLPAGRLLVIVDDADLPLGELRMRPGGGTGGHHGLESIESHLGTKEFARLRVGIGRQNAARQIVGHVLGKFSSTEAAVLDKVLVAAAAQAETWMDSGIQKAMNLFNGVVKDTANESKAQ